MLHFGAKLSLLMLEAVVMKVLHSYSCHAVRGGQMH